MSQIKHFSLAEAKPRDLWILKAKRRKWRRKRDEGLRSLNQTAAMKMVSHVPYLCSTQINSPVLFYNVAINVCSGEAWYLVSSSVIPDSPQQIETREPSPSPEKEVESVSHVSDQMLKCRGNKKPIYSSSRLWRNIVYVLEKVQMIQHLCFLFHSTETLKWRRGRGDGSWNLEHL